MAAAPRRMVPASSQRPLVLASTSRHRVELLERLEVPFVIAAPRFDEAAFDERFGDLDDGSFALSLARGKADSLRTDHAAAFILAADQIAVLDAPRRLLRKPSTIDDAVAQLMTLSGRTHALVTGVVVLDARTGECHEAIDRQRMTMRAFEEAEARRYVERYRPLDSVGAYHIEDAGIALFRSTEGEDYTGIIGLPLIAVAELLRTVGLLPPAC